MVFVVVGVVVVVFIQVGPPQFARFLSSKCQRQAQIQEMKCAYGECVCVCVCGIVFVFLLCLPFTKI